MYWSLKTLNWVHRCLVLSKLHITTQAGAGVKNGMEKENFTVCVEGNIASGKTSFLEHFKKNPNVEVFGEPIRKWRDVHGYNALAKFYEDPRRWSLTLESYAQLTMLEIHRKKTVKPVKLMERSIYSSRYCFVESLHQSGLLDGLDYVILEDWFNWIVNNNDCHVDLIVYLQANPETLRERIKLRNLREEQNISWDYLRKLHDLHEEWLIERSKFSLPSKVLVIPAEQSLQEMHQIYDKREKEILCRFSQEFNMEKNVCN